MPRLPHYHRIPQLFLVVLPRLLLASHQAMTLLALLDIQLLLLRALGADRREIEQLALPSLQSLPHAIIVPVLPQQGADPGLHIPSQLQPRIRPVL